jgi:hypothetical protein
VLTSADQRLASLLDSLRPRPRGAPWGMSESVTAGLLAGVLPLLLLPTPRAGVPLLVLLPPYAALSLPASLSNASLSEGLAVSSQSSMPLTGPEDAAASRLRTGACSTPHSPVAAAAAGSEVLPARPSCVD